MFGLCDGQVVATVVAAGTDGTSTDGRCCGRRERPRGVPARRVRRLRSGDRAATSTRLWSGRSATVPRRGVRRRRGRRRCPTTARRPAQTRSSSRPCRLRSRCSPSASNGFGHPDALGSCSGGREAGAQLFQTLHGDGSPQRRCGAAGRRRRGHHRRRLDGHRGRAELGALGHDPDGRVVRRRRLRLLPGRSGRRRRRGAPGRRGQPLRHRGAAVALLVGAGRAGGLPGDRPRVRRRAGRRSGRGDPRRDRCC